MITNILGKLRLALAGFAMTMAATMAMAENTQPFDYSGAYAGFSMTYGFGESEWIDPVGPSGTGSFELSGRGGGAILGYNWRVGRVYYGLALDITVNQISGTGYGGCAAGCATTVESYAALRAQVGQRVGDGHLYGFAGAAIGRADLNPVGLARQHHDVGGWLAGIGYERPLDDGWTLRAELQYMDFEDTVYSASGPVQTVSGNRVGMLRIGLVRYF